ncbi:MAG: hypothetical protein RLP15_03205 [Cryomorphaceae bacterium]
MKKLLLTISAIAFIAVACGPSEEERAKAQAENEKAVNEKVDALLKSMSADTAAPAVENDTMSTDSTSAETE